MGGADDLKSTRLIVKNLPREVDELALQKHINDIYGGNITDCRIMRKQGSQKSRMFAFVGFRDIEAAARALKLLNGTYYNTRRLEIAYALSEGNPALPRPWSSITKQKSGTEQKPSPAEDIKGGRTQPETETAVQSFLEGMEEGTRKNRKRLRNAAKDDGDHEVDGGEWLKQRVNTETKGPSADHESQTKSARLAADTGRLRVLNIPYEATEEDIRKEFSRFGQIAEINMPVAKEDSTMNRGFCFITFTFPMHACNALAEMDNCVIQGRKITVEGAEDQKSGVRVAEEEKVMGARKRAKVKSEVRRALEEDKMRRHKSAKTWNLLYTSGSATLDVISSQMGLQRADIMDASNASDSVAARAAVAETLVVRQVKDWLESQGLESDAFEREGKNGVLGADVERCDDTIIVKHLGTDADADRLREMFSRYGRLTRFALCPTKTVAIVSFAEPLNARTAFKELLLKRYNAWPLLLEWAPLTLLKASSPIDTAIEDEADAQEMTAAADVSTVRSTLFVANLSFATTEERLTEVFSDCVGFRKATLAKKKSKVKDLKSGKDKETWLSMGYGFVEFDSAESATSARKKLTSLVLDGHALRIDESQPTTDGSKAAKKARKVRATEEAEAESAQLKATRKLMVKNLPFEANTQDLKQLFETFGSIRSVRIPKKKDGSSRGYGFVDFASVEDAAKAMKELRHTHLLGRHLVLLPTAEGSEEVQPSEKDAGIKK